MTKNMTKMDKAKKKKNKQDAKAKAKMAKRAKNDRPPVRREIAALFFFFLAVFTCLGLFGVSGWFLDFLSGLCRGAIGRGFYVLPFALLIAALALLFHRDRPVVARVICLTLLPVAIGAVVHLFGPDAHYEWSFGMVSVLIDEGLALASGGLVSGLLALALSAAVSKVGAAIVLVVSALVLLLVITRLNIVRIIGAARRPRKPPPEGIDPQHAQHAQQAHQAQHTQHAQQAQHVGSAQKASVPAVGKRRTKAELPPPWGGQAAKPGGARRRNVDIPLDEDDSPSPFGSAPGSAKDPASSSMYAFPVEDKAPVTVPAPAPARAAEIIKSAPRPYRLPPITLLAEGRPAPSQTEGAGELKNNAALLTGVLKSFGIEARIVSVTRGPTVARYELELGSGVKLSRLTGLADDIALSLGATGVRIAPIPGKMSVVGIEAPNKLTSIVYLRDVVTSPEFTGMKSKVAFAVGKDIGGTPIVADLARLTHLLIAGATGAGKSVCINSLIVSLLYKASSDEVRLIMIDPKMVELGVYNGIPHLLLPVVTDYKRAAGALHKVVVEMEDRYNRFMNRNVRDINAYNQAIADDPDPDSDSDAVPMPRIVVIIDELADLMLSAAREVEEPICRIAQKARAAGIHLVIATQRPSADVITGLMKANIPSRIAFAVASQLESRIILDTMGAEKLVGRGDMLLYPLGAPKPFRVQGCLVTGAEVEEIVKYVKASDIPRYSEDYMNSIEAYAEQMGKKHGDTASMMDAEGSAVTEGLDEMFAAAVEIVLESGQASVSYLQRRLKLGFSRAARLVDQMEERGIVGPSEGSKPRKLLISRHQWSEMLMRGSEGAL